MGLGGGPEKCLQELSAVAHRAILSDSGGADKPVNLSFHLSLSLPMRSCALL